MKSIKPVWLHLGTLPNLVASIPAHIRHFIMDARLRRVNKEIAGKRLCAFTESAIYGGNRLQK
jgi:hypothetical protein